MEVRSPVTGSKNTSWLRYIATSYIAEKYEERFGIDVSSYFKGRRNVSMYRDNDTGYRFYYPFDIAGDGKFYEQLQQFDWYYMPWKWEHEQCTKIVREGEKILEVGCARGAFLHTLQQKKDVAATGLELNDSAVEAGRKQGIDIRPQTVQQHAEEFAHHYDLVCSFQVLEHITAVRSFIEANIQCLNEKGKIVFSVPNNGAFIKHDWKNHLLNFPPHHMGLWDEAVFRNIASVFGLQLVDLLFEPLQSYHLNWYLSIMEKRYLSNPLVKKGYERLRMRKWVSKAIDHNRHRIHGPTIMAVFSVS